MSKNKCIQAECEADTLLVEVLGFKKPGHQQGVSNLMKAFEKNPGLLIIGVIDKDKRQPSQMDDFEAVESHKNIVKLRHKINKQHYLILHPNLEVWLYKTEAQIAGVNPADFKFKSSGYFREVAKSKDAFSNPDLRNFFYKIGQKSTALQKMKEWLEELVL